MMDFAIDLRMAVLRPATLRAATLRPVFTRAVCTRALAGILVVGGALLLHPRTILAQAAGLEPSPYENVVPQMAPGIGGSAVDAMVDEIVADTGAASTPSDVIHVVEVGDTLTNIAQRYGVEIANLAAYNQILDYNNVVLGQKLRIPPVGVTITAPAVVTLPGAEGYHVVRKGEGLAAIARLYGLTLDELLALNDIADPNLVQMGTMLRLTDKVEPPDAAMQPDLMVITYTVARGDTLAEIAEQYNTTTGQILADNKLDATDVRVGQELKIFPPASSLQAFGVDAPADGERKIVIDLSDQSLTAYQGDVAVLYSIVSTGKDATPTRVGEFHTYQKLETQHMTGEDYDLPGVPWVMYYDGEMAIHGAYWHANFGIPTSHGCTNMSIPESKALYSWAPLGTRVIVQP